MKYRCRTIKPSITEWFEIEASSPNEAACEYFGLNDHLSRFRFRHELGDGKIEFIHFGLVEIEGYNEVVVRNFITGIFRLGNKRLNSNSLEDIAKEIGWQHPLDELVSEGWDFEESWAEAEKK